MKYLFYAIVFDVAGNITPVGSLTSPAKTITTNIQNVTGISINPNSAQTKNIGETFTITVTVSPSDANNKSVNWSSSNTNIATVDSSGNVRCLSAGTTTITATASDGSGKSASLELTVRNPVNSISLSQSSITIAKDGFTANISLTIDPSDYSDSNISWDIGNTSIATLSGSGKTRTITSTSTIGDTTLTVTAGGKTTTCAIHVVAFTSQTFSYTGTVQYVDLPAGKYKLECWGAQGGSGNGYSGGYGGYSVGTITLTNNTTLYIHVGGQGAPCPGSGSFQGTGVGGWNGGGSSTYASGGGQPSYGGGGGTDISLYGTKNSTDWNNSNHLYSRIIVAGGGGGATWSGGNTSQSAGGGIKSAGGRYPASQISAGYNGGFGYGANRTCSDYPNGTGGGGWYGGGSTNASMYFVASGGSGYVYTSATSSSYPSGCKLNSSYYLTNASTSTNTHTGNGQAKITLIN